MTEIPEVYLDHNATTPPLAGVLEAMQETARVAWGNPSSVHAAGRRARAIVEQARESVARLLGVHARDLVFTSGATEANNLALRAATTLVTSRLEHPSVTRQAEALAEAGRRVVWLPIPPSGRLEAGDVEAAVRGLEPGFVAAVMAANHETGVIQPIEEIAEVVHEAGGRLHVDAVQAAGKLDRAAWAGADSVSLSAHKIRGPKGIGALGWTSGRPPEPVLLGGAQQRGIRPGTVDPVAAAGFRVAVEHAEAGPRRHAALRPLRDDLERVLARFGRVNGGEPRLSHVTNVSMSGWRGDELVAALDLGGLRIASGSACSAGTSEPSAVIRAMLGTERAASAVRVSLGEVTLRRDIDHAIAVLDRVLGAHLSSGSSIP